MKRRRNYVIHTLKYKYKRFKKTPEVQREVRKLYRRVSKNILINIYNKKHNKRYSSKLSFDQFLYLRRGKDKKMIRLSRYYSTRFNLTGFDFFQVSKQFYNKNILIE